MRSAVLLGALLTACAAAPPPGARDAGADASVAAPPAKPAPFGSHPLAYPARALRPTGTAAALDGAVTRFYDGWKTRYQVAGCGGVYVRTQGGTGAAAAVTISEAHGYGMIAAAIMAGHDPDARASFDGYWRVFRKFPSRNNPDLMAWAIGDKCEPIEGQNSATDGDLDVAFALLLAHRQWGSDGAVDYFGEARKVIAAIARSDFNRETSLPLLGDWATSADFYYSTRPSDFMFDHFRAFAPYAASSLYETAIERAYRVVDQLQAPAATGLVPDFAVGTNSNVRPAPPNFLEEATDGDYSYNACRVPWRLGTDFVVSGDARASKALALLNAWVLRKTGGDPAKIAAGYSLDGSRTLEAATTAAFIAPFAVAALADGSSQAWLDALWKWMAEAPPQEYYADTLRLLSMIVVSGNWVAP